MNGPLVFSDLDQPAGFRCPTCGEQHTGEIAIRVETITEDRYSQVPMWPGGPLADDRGAPPERVAVDQIVSTNACEHRFALSEWAWALHRDTTSDRQWMTFEAKP